MLVTNIRISIAKSGNGLITYTWSNMTYKVFITKDDPVIFEIFIKYYSRLIPFKLRHYALAEWIARDIRANGYVFKAYYNNNMNIRPVKVNSDIISQKGESDLELQTESRFKDR